MIWVGSTSGQAALVLIGFAKQTLVGSSRYGPYGSIRLYPAAAYRAMAEPCRLPVSSLSSEKPCDLAPEKRSSWLMMESETGATR
jgi:hypothetical protein